MEKIQIEMTDKEAVKYAMSLIHVGCLLRVMDEQESASMSLSLIPKYIKQVNALLESIDKACNVLAEIK